MLFLLALLPLQLTWAAVGSYCQHETGAAAAHWSHHEHAHEDRAQPNHAGDGGKASEPGQDSRIGQVQKTAPALADLDCATCHAVCAAAPLPAALQWAGSYRAALLASPYRLHHSAPLPVRRDRPQWPVLLSSAAGAAAFSL